MGPHCTGTLPPSDIWWPSVETSPNLFTSGPPCPPSPAGADIWWLLKHMRSAQVGGMHPTGMSIRIVLMAAV